MPFLTLLLYYYFKPYFLLNFSIRPWAAAKRWRPVKNGWQLLQVSTRNSSPLIVLPVSNSAPQDVQIHLYTEKSRWECLWCRTSLSTDSVIFVWKAQERKQRHRILRHVQCTQTCSRQEHSHPTTRWLTNCRVIYSGDREATSSMFRQTAHREMNGWAGPEMHRYSVVQPPTIFTQHYFSENCTNIWSE